MHQLQIRLISIAIFQQKIIKNKFLVNLKSMINIFHHNFFIFNWFTRCPAILENRTKTLFGRSRKNFSAVENFNKFWLQKVRFLVVLRHLSLKFWKILIFNRVALFPTLPYNMSSIIIKLYTFIKCI